MHIALCSPAWPLEKYQNGIVTYVHWMRRALQAKGHRVSVFTAVLAPGTSEPGVYHVPDARSPAPKRLLRLLSRGRLGGYAVFEYAAQMAAALVRVHRQDPIDVIEMEESFGWFADVAARTRLPVLVKLHGPAFLSLVEAELHTVFGQVKIDREGEALRGCAAIASPSTATLASTITRYGLRPQETYYIVNPLTMDGDTPLWTLEGCDRQSILYVGRFDLRKGADVILKAFRLLLSSRPALRLTFVGPDRGIPGPDGTLLPFDAYCASLFAPELRSRIEFRGSIANAQIAQLRTRSMLTVVGSRWENCSYALLEAMFQGCPVVSTDAGGCPEAVIEGATGRLAKSGDPEDFARQIAAMLDDPERAQALGRAARQHVLELHSPERLAQLSLEAYQAVIARAR